MIASYSFWSIKTLFLRSRLDHWYKTLKSYDDLWDPDVISVTDIIQHSIVHLAKYNKIFMRKIHGETGGIWQNFTSLLGLQLRKFIFMWRHYRMMLLVRSPNVKLNYSLGGRGYWPREKRAKAVGTSRGTRILASKKFWLVSSHRNDSE